MRKGEFTPQADRFYAAADILVIANSATTQSRLGRFVNNRRGNDFRARRVSENKSLIKLTGAEGVVIASEASWHQPHPHAVKITV